MEVLYWIVRIYKWWLIAWVLMTWIPGLAGSPLHDLLAIPVWPVLAPFDFLHIGPIGFGPIIPLLVLNWLEGWLGERAGILQSDDAAQEEYGPSVKVTDLKGPAQVSVAPAEPPSGNIGI